MINQSRRGRHKQGAKFFYVNRSLFRTRVGRRGKREGKTSVPAFLCVTFAVTILMSCGQRPTKPLVLTEQIGQLPTEFTSPRCDIPVLSTPPVEDYEIIARVKTYGNPGTDMGEMQQALHREACALGAQAVIMRPLKEGEFADAISATHLGYSNVREYTSTAEYAFQIVGLAIRYKASVTATTPHPEK